MIGVMTMMYCDIHTAPIMYPIYITYVIVMDLNDNKGEGRASKICNGATSEVCKNQGKKILKTKTKLTIAAKNDKQRMQHHTTNPNHLIDHSSYPHSASSG